MNMLHYFTLYTPKGSYVVCINAGWAGATGPHVVCVPEGETGVMLSPAAYGIVAERMANGWELSLA